MTLPRDERETLESLAYFLLRHDRLDEADQLLDGLCACAPESAYGWYGRSVVAQRRGDERLAAEFLTACCARTDDLRYRLTLGETLLRLGRPAQAAAVLDEVARGEAPLRTRAVALLRRLRLETTGCDPS